jgi:hypothetical protein
MTRDKAGSVRLRSVIAVAVITLCGGPILAACSSGPSRSYSAGYSAGVGYRESFGLQEGRPLKTFRTSLEVANLRCKNAADSNYAAYGYDLAQWLDGCETAMESK